MTKVLVPLADGVEEMEAVIIIDVFRRAQWEVVCAGIKDGPVTASRGVILIPDTDINNIDINSFDILAIPGGGEGTNNLSSCQEVLNAAKYFSTQGKLICAICAGPLVLQAAGILNGKKATCHPSATQELSSADTINQRVVVDGNLVTSQGPGTSFEFALKIVEIVDGPEKANALSKAMVLDQ